MNWKIMKYPFRILNEMREFIIVCVFELCRNQQTIRNLYSSVGWVGIW